MGLLVCRDCAESLTESEEQDSKVATVSISCYRGGIGGIEWLSKLPQDAQPANGRAVYQEGFSCKQQKLILDA